MNKKNFFLILFLLLLPVAYADLITPFLPSFFGASATILLIPIVIIETIAAFFILKKTKIEIKLWSITVTLLFANIISAILGIPFSFLLPFSSKNTLNVIWLLLPALIFSILIEAYVIRFVFRNSLEIKKNSFKISIPINVISYVLIFILLIGLSINESNNRHANFERVCENVGGECMSIDDCKDFGLEIFEEFYSCQSGYVCCS